MSETELDDSNRVVSCLKKLFRDKIPNADLKIDEQLKIFRESEAVVVCEDCLELFFSGKTRTIVETKCFVDWKMLAFRHAWDTRHKVVIFLPYFGVSLIRLSTFNKLISPEDNSKVLFYKLVEEKREKYLMNNDARAHKSFDGNWDLNSQCFCSTCGTAYYDPQDACYCCYGSKPWMPFEEVNTIKVK